MKFIGIIPARYASTRFPGKPLADMKGKYMIQRVYEQVRKILDNVCVATDDDRIFNAVKSFGGNVVMTSAEHRSRNRPLLRSLQSSGRKRRRNHQHSRGRPFIKPEQIGEPHRLLRFASNPDSDPRAPLRGNRRLRGPRQSQLSEGHSQRQKRSTLFQPFDNSLYEKYIPRTMAR